ncbi:hypothetical protein [Haloferula sp. BvORR071]|uniref:hypothetical protein n=1 Tax=Haloferula sp. BvORR071 TaxID=1396141 RepID=UPI0009465132|nr:hypothetical protein [Haloferula sp. BvORR071]
MKIVLNSRTIVGPQHAQAAAFASEWPPGNPVSIEWIESSSSRCVLAVEIPEDQPVILTGTVAPLDGHDARGHLEIDLRDNLGLPPYKGEDADHCENSSV